MRSGEGEQGHTQICCHIDTFGRALLLMSSNAKSFPRLRTHSDRACTGHACATSPAAGGARADSGSVLTVCAPLALLLPKYCIFSRFRGVHDVKTEVISPP